MKPKPSMRYVAILAALCLLSVGISGCISQSGYEFKTGTMHPTVVNDLLKKGTVVLFLTQNNCPTCEQVKPKIADLQSQFNGTNVTFAHFNLDDNSTSKSLFGAYAVKSTPTTVIVRKDGAIATFIGDFDTSTVKSAIQDAQKWK